MTTVHRWPAGLAPRGISFNLRGQTVAGPVSLTGRTQVAEIDAGYWVASLSEVPAGGPDGVKSFRRLRAKLKGGAAQIAVPVFDVANAPWPVAGVYATADGAYSDGTKFTDGYGFFEPNIRIVVGAAADARATQITVTITAAATIVGGEYFSIKGRLYQIAEVVSSAGGTEVWSIVPPLREAITTADRIDMDRLTCTCVMRLADEGAADLGLTMGRYGYPSMNFVEVI